MDVIFLLVSCSHVFSIENLIGILLKDLCRNDSSINSMKVYGQKRAKSR